MFSKIIFLIGISLLGVYSRIIKDNDVGEINTKRLHEINSHRFISQINKLKSSDVNIDGKSSTIGLTIGWFLGGMYNDVDMMSTVSETLSPTSGEDNHYFDIIKDDVKEVVGDYINQHNMDQLLVYKNDLASLMSRYHEAPIQSDNYPDKTKMANSLSTSIISNRYLIEAVEMPQSMILHYSDIASIHIMVLKDVAETYSSESFISRWWQDLDHELDHYIDYGHKLQNSVVDWRNDMVDCSFREASSGCTMWEWAGRVCYDKWILNDKVWETTDTCTQLHGHDTCKDHCQAYQVAMNREVVLWIWEYMGKALNAWEELKVQSSQMAKEATAEYRN